MNKKVEKLKVPKRAPRPGEGRPSKYDPSYCQRIIDFFDRPLFKEKSFGSKAPELNELPTLEYFAAKELGVTKQTLHNWAAEHPEFLAALNRAKELQTYMLVQGGVSRAYDPTFTKFLLNSVSDTYKDKPIQVEPTDEAKNLIRLGYALPEKVNE